MLEILIVASNFLLVVVTAVVAIEQGLVDETLHKLVVLMSGGSVRKALTYGARHYQESARKCLECARAFARKVGKHERPKHQAL